MIARLYGAVSSSPSTSATQSTTIAAGMNTGWAGGTVRNSFFALKSGQTATISSLSVTVTTAPGTGKSWDFNVLKNGVTTGVTVHIADTATTGSDLVNISGNYGPGDTIGFQSVPTGTPTATGVLSWNYLVTTTDQSMPILGGNFATLTSPSATPNFMSLFTANSSGDYSTTEVNVEVICPTAGTLSDMYVGCLNAPGVGNTDVVTLVQNGVATSLAATITGAGTTGNDTAHSVTVAAGDTLSMQITGTGTPAATNFRASMCWSPTTNGETWIGFGNVNDPGTAAAYEQPLAIGNNGWNSVESTRQSIPGAVTATAMYVKLVVASGAAKSRTFALRAAGVDTAITVTLTNVTTNNITGQTVTFGSTDSMTVGATSSGTPTASGGVKLGVLFFTTQPGGAVASSSATLALMGVG